MNAILPDWRKTSEIELDEEQELRKLHRKVEPWEKERLRPWCRVCQKPVQYAKFDTYENGFHGFFVRCHGESMGGLVSSLQHGGEAKLEVFCDEEPHMKEGFWWWVDIHGHEMQPAQSYIKTTQDHRFIRTLASYRRAIAIAGALVVLLFMWIYSLPLSHFIR